jgi:hypothetical protein
MQLCVTISLRSSGAVAGGVVARLRNEGEDYLDYYCSAPEEITEEIREDLRLLGWKVL